MAQTYSFGAVVAKDQWSLSDANSQCHYGASVAVQLSESWLIISLLVKVHKYVHLIKDLVKILAIFERRFYFTWLFEHAEFSKYCHHWNF